MSGLAGIGRITDRIGEIQRGFGAPARLGNVSFRDALAAAEGSRFDSGRLGSVSATNQVVVSEYTTLGGAPILVTAPPSGLLADPALLPPTEEWSGLLPDRSEPYVDMIESVAVDAGLDPRLLASVVWAESTFVPDAVSSAGAIGLAQLMPGTAAGLGVDPWDPESNLRGGASYLVQQIERFGTLELGLAAYNAGPGRVLEHDGAPEYTRAYIDRVTGYYEMLGGSP